MKLRCLNKLLLPPITPRILRSGVRPLRCSCWAFFAASCLLFSGVSRADLTQSEIEQAILNALQRPPVSFSGGGLNTVPWLFPGYSGLTIGEWLVYASGYGANPYSSTGTLHDDLLKIIQEIQKSRGVTNSLDEIRDILITISGSLSVVGSDVSGIGSEVQFIASAVSRMESEVDSVSSNVSYFGSLWDLVRDGDRWRVHDSELQTALLDSLSGNRSSVEGISDAIAPISESVGGMYYFLSDISGQLSSISQNWLTQDQLENVLDSQEEPPHDEPPDDSSEKEQAERSAEYEWTQAESTSYSNRWELAEWKYTEMLPGNASIVSENPSFNPGGTGFSPDDSGIPLFARLVEAQEFGMSIDSSVIEPGDYPVFMSYYNEFRVRWARIFHAVWDFVGAFLIFFIARREWKYYMGVGDNSPEVESDSGGIF